MYLFKIKLLFLARMLVLNGILIFMKRIIMSNYCYFNGKILPENDAHISLNDLGLLRSYGVFDSIKTYNGKPFLLEEHLSRFQHSAEEIGLRVPLSNEKIKKIISDLIKQNKLNNNIAIKLVLTGGESQDGVSCNFSAPTFFITVKQAPQHPVVVYQNGVKLITYQHQRNFPSAKTTEYLTFMPLQKRKKELDAYEILYFNHGIILEGATSSIFFFKGDTLITPKNNILIGITQQFIVNLAKTDFKIEQRDIALGELSEMSEAFIASTMREIVPVVKIDNLVFGNQQVGKNTKYLMQIFAEHVKNY